MLQVSWQLVAGVNIPLVPRTVIPIDNSSCSSLPPPTTSKQPCSVPTHTFTINRHLLCHFCNQLVYSLIIVYIYTLHTHFHNQQIPPLMCLCVHIHVLGYMIILILKGLTLTFELPSLCVECLPKHNFVFMYTPISYIHIHKQLKVHIM